MPVKDFEAAMEERGFGSNAIRSGCREAGGNKYRQGFGKEGVWMVQLPRSGPDEGP
jgi:hypothetical protein